MTTVKSIRVAFMVLAGMLSISTSRAMSAEFYYVLIFGSQSSPKLLRYTHTWATFVKATGEGSDPAGYTLEAHTISWLPATLDVRVWAARPETGVNLPLEQSLQAVYARGENVNLWGPFQIGPQVWNRSLEIRQILESGTVQYRAISGPMNLLISDCIHAVAAVDPEFGRGHYPLIRIGKPASRYAARQLKLRGQYDNTSVDHSWLIPRLGLQQYPINVISPAEIPDRPCALCKLPD
jgi:hypothetical protein